MRELTRYFHVWDKDKIHRGIFVPVKGLPPADECPYYVERAMPKCPEQPNEELPVDGWYLVHFRGDETKRTLVREKRGRHIYNDLGQKTSASMGRFEVVARLPDIVWSDERQEQITQNKRE